MPGGSNNASARAQQALGFPEGIKFYSPYPFGGMNTEASPPAVDDKEFIWRENFIRMGDGNLRTAWDAGTSIYTAPGGKTIIYFAFYTIGATYYCAVFLSDGSAIQINTNTLVHTTIGTSGFYSAVTGYKPFVRQWGSQYILICNRNTMNDYWVWDGALLYTAGTAAPDGINIVSGGLNYSTTPTVTVFGGLGSGLTVTPVVQGGSVVQVKITNPGHGYEVGDVPQLAFSGGGSNTTPELTANLNAGGVGGVSITAGGSTYTSATVSFSGGGCRHQSDFRVDHQYLHHQSGHRLYLGPHGVAGRKWLRRDAWNGILWRRRHLRCLDHQSWQWIHFGSGCFF